MKIPKVTKGQMVEVCKWEKPDYTTTNVTALADSYWDDTAMTYLFEFKEKKLYLKKAYWDGERWCVQQKQDPL
jgi:hypothetical protein